MWAAILTVPDNQCGLYVDTLIYSQSVTAAYEDMYVLIATLIIITKLSRRCRVPGVKTLARGYVGDNSNKPQVLELLTLSNVLASVIINNVISSIF